VRLFSLAGVRIGDCVEVRGIPGSGSSLIATLVERNKPDTQVLLQGLGGSLATPSFTILGVQIMTNGRPSSTGRAARNSFLPMRSARPCKCRARSPAVVVADRVQIKH
jgi:hypothetical protein